MKTTFLIVASLLMAKLPYSSTDFPWYNISHKSSSQHRLSKLFICYMWHCILNPDMEDCDIYDFQNYMLDSIFYQQISNKKTYRFYYISL